MSSAEPLLRLSRIHLRLGGRSLLHNIDLAVHRGEIVTLVGLNGAGKSSLLRVALGLQAVQSGEVWRRPGLVIGYAPQHLPVDATLPLTVRRFLQLAAPQARFAEWLAEVQLEAVLDKQLVTLSGGELQRVMLARALMKQPDLLVLDEPLAGVDVGGQGDLYGLIGRMRDRYGFGVLLVSHDLHLVMAATDKVICLNHHVCCTGHPEAVANHPEFVALFGREVAAGLAIYPHHHDHAHDAHGDVIPLADGESAQHG